MPRIPTATFEPTKVSAGIQRQVYNGLDCCLTMEIFQVLDEQLRRTNFPEPKIIYNFERAMQAPALDMMLRGFRIDQYHRREGIAQLQKRQQKLETLLDKYAKIVWKKGLNPNSHIQMKNFFYWSSDGLRLPEQFKIDKGVRKVSTDRECLEKLMAYFYAQPIINVVIAIRDTIKKISVLTSEVDHDGRMRTSYNVAGTETGRWSSSANAFGGGTNLQNITPELRRMFISDSGQKLCNLDLSQAESFIVGLLIWATTGDDSYLKACESGDLHTSTARLVWNMLGWTGDKSLDREIAEQLFYRQFSYRDMSKRGGHLTNYYGTARTAARHLKVEPSLMENFQSNYFRAFPGMGGWHKWTAKELGINQVLITPLGRRRTFFGRPEDDTTLREAIAFVPQSTVADILNYILYKFLVYLRPCQLLAQVYDSVVFQYPLEAELDVVPRALEMAIEPITMESVLKPGTYRTITIPSECKIGWNWADQTIKTSLGKKIHNPDGLIKFTGKPDERKRLEGLARIIS